MNVRGFRAVSMGMGCALVLTSAGCPKQRSTMDRPPEVNPRPPVETSAEVRVDELGERSRKFAQTAERLPGRSAEEHRALVQQAFLDLSQILPILYGPNPSGVQRQQLRGVESARSQLWTAPRGLAPEPTIDTGLRAARDSLASLGRGTYFDRPELAETLDRLDATVADLDAAKGTNHQQVVAETVDLMSQAVNQMTAALDERLQGDAGPGQPGRPQPEQPGQPEQQQEQGGGGAEEQGREG
jgi:hypothetical protein